VEVTAMPVNNRLMDRLADEYRALSTQYDEILTRCDDEGRDPNDHEAQNLDGLRSEMGPLGERLIELRETEDRRYAAVRAMAEAPEAPPESNGNRSMVHVRTEPEVYRRAYAAGGERFGFFRDLLHAQMDADPEARSRLERHATMMRAAGTTTTGTGMVPPTWLFEEFAIIAHGARPWADTLRRVGITDANPVNIGVQVAPGAAVTAQASENTIPNDGSLTVNLLTTSPKTYTGKVDVSRQLIDGSNPAVDGIVYADCMGSYNEQIETAVVTAIDTAASYAATIVYPGTAPVYTELFSTFIDAGASVRKHRKAPPRVIFCSEGAWAFMGKEKDTQGRPYVITGYHGPVNAFGLGEAVTYGQVAGEVVGLSVVPSWAGIDNHLYVAKADDLLLLESSTFNFRYEEVLGPESIRLGVWGYAAPVVGRYPNAIAKIDAGSTIPAPLEEEPAAQPADELAEGGPGNGPGAARRNK
jgi:HK97 family phage major capsid protein